MRARHTADPGTGDARSDDRPTSSLGPTAAAEDQDTAAAGTSLVAGMIDVPLDAFLDIQLRIPRLSPLPTLDGSLGGWPETARLPDLSGLHDQDAFARVWAGWTVEGLAIAFDVAAAHALYVDPDHPYRSDGVQIWCDTRDSRLARKPTRYCHHFILLPGGGRRPFVMELNPGGVKKPGEMADVGCIRAAAREVSGRGYALEVFLPREVLHGYAPLETPSVGLGYRVRDSQGGVQDLAFGERFPLWRNPSLWRSVRLEGAGGA